MERPTDSLDVLASRLSSTVAMKNQQVGRVHLESEHTASAAWTASVGHFLPPSLVVSDPADILHSEAL